MHHEHQTAAFADRKNAKTTQNRQNDYLQVRQIMGLTRERWAEMTAASAESVRDYESGKTIPPDEWVIRAIEVSGQTWLALQHMKNKPVGQKYLPDVEHLSFAGSVLNLTDELDDVVGRMKELRGIAKDGIVSTDEESAWSDIQRDLLELAMAIMSTVYATK